MKNLHSSTTKKDEAQTAEDRAQFTPGPWIVRAVRGAAGQPKRVWVQQEQTGTIAQIHAGARVLERNPIPTLDEINAIKDANARLIAAAPDLLDTVKQLHAYMSGVMEYDHGVMNNGGTPRVLVCAAIAKAEGRAQ